MAFLPGIKRIKLILFSRKRFIFILNSIEPSNLTLETLSQYKQVLYIPEMIVVLGLPEDVLLKVWNNPIRIYPSFFDHLKRRSENT